ncbi:MAG: magnesium transporter [SAR202 cluster bacterium]|nr:magnesium transporter [SAR202 cluster bacterium]
MTVAQSLERIRKLALRRETIYVAYVIDDQRHLLGTVSLKDLVIAPPEAKLGDIMTVNPKWVSTHTDQEEVAQVLRDYDILAVPVVDAEERLVGIVTWDDVVDIMEQETTEDIYRLGALQGGEQGNYFTTSILNVMRRRVVWLLLLVLVNTVTGSIIGWHNDLLQQFVILTIFIPLVMGTGGNVGAQSSTVVIRGLATGEIKSSEAAKIVAREVSVGLAMGVIIGVLAFSWAFAWRHQIEVAVSVGLALLGISAMATFVGVTLPFLFRLFKVDPALVSAPLITTVMDIFGITFYLVIATIMLRGIL